MKALVYRGPGKKALEDRPMPRIDQPTDAIVRITKTTICGTDLHILKGDVASCAPGRILGHEGVGIIDEFGPGVTGFAKGDPCSDLLHFLLREMRILPARHVFPLRRPAAGFWATRLMAPRRNMSASPTPIPASTRFPPGPTKKLW